MLFKLTHAVPEFADHKTSCACSDESPLRHEALAEPGRRPRAYTSVRPIQANIGRRRRSFFADRLKSTLKVGNVPKPGVWTSGENALRASFEPAWWGANYCR